MSDRHFRRGDWVIYCKTKCSIRPGPRAHDIRPAPYGDTYTYQVEKFWQVLEEHPDGTVTLVTRTGKQHRLPADHPCLRAPRFWERWLYRNRFPSRIEGEACGSSA